MDPQKSENKKILHLVTNGTKEMLEEGWLDCG